MLESETKSLMQQVVENLRAKMSKVRTGKAQVSMLDGITVNYYGSPTPLNQVANLTCPDPKSFLITPWEKSVLKDIETAIVASDLSIAPINDGKVIRLKLPTLTEERRGEIVKQVGKMVEDSKIKIRQCRRDANEQIKSGIKDKSLSEDEGHVMQSKQQELTDEFIKIIDELYEKKEKELMTI